MLVFVVLLCGLAAAPVRAAVAGDPAELIASAKKLMLSDPQQAERTAAAAKAQIVAMGGATKVDLLATAEWLEGEALIRLGKTDVAKPVLDQAWRRVSIDPRPTKLKGDLLLSLGGAASVRADVSSALADYQHAYRIFRDVGETRSEAISLLSIASLYVTAYDNDSALKYYSQALETYGGDPSLNVSIHNNLRNLLMDEHKYELSKKQFDQALTIAKSMNSRTLQAQILRNVARMQLYAGDPAGAQASIDEGLVLTRGLKDSSWGDQFLAVSAWAAFERKENAKAVALIDKLFSRPDTTDDTLDLRQAHNIAYEIYKRQGRDDLALQHLEALKKLDDQTASLAASANTALMAARFDYTNQNLKIAKLQAQDLQRKITYERAHARTVRLIFISAAGVTLVIILMLSAGLVIIRRSRNEERAAKNDLAETNTALAKALAAKTEFLATTSHEIRTPLNGILGMTQVMLADRTLPDSARERLGVVHSAGVTMRALVDDILDVAKMETGNMTIERAPMDVCEVLRDVARVWQDQARARGLNFVLSLDQCPAIVEGDAARLRQVVFNLLSNALKFTERGTITLHGYTEQGERGERVRIDVTDTGIGIAPDKLDEVFESFRQADASTTRRFGGTGLGLAICRNLARAMDGDVSVVSEPGAGTTFTIDLPLIAAALPQACGTDPSQPTEALLIVDRNPITRSMLRALLEEPAGTVEFAGTIPEAAERAAHGGVALVLVDEATARAAGEAMDDDLRSLAAAANGVTIALLWNKPADAEVDALRSLGVTRIIAKPIAGPALRQALYPADAPKGDDRGERHLVSDAA
jgi:signal transduction histidine kinase/CheY-like chemotaxis protein